MKYNFLSESVPATQGIKKFANNASKPLAQNLARTLSIIGATKPLKIGSISKLINAPISEIQQKVNYQLSRLQKLSLDLNAQMNNAKNPSMRFKKQMEIRQLMTLQSIHKNFYNSIISYRKKFPQMADPNVVNKMYSEYCRSLQIANLNIQRTKIQFTNNVART